MFFSLDLEHQKAMSQSHFMANATEKRGELICAILMRWILIRTHGKSCRAQIS
jgi:hypothetical protein